MTLDDLNTIQELIKLGKLEEALNELNKFILNSSKLTNKRLLITSRLIELENKYHNKLIGFETYSIQKSNLINSILAFSSETYEYNNNPTLQRKESLISALLTIIFFLGLVFLLGVIIWVVPILVKEFNYSVEKTRQEQFERERKKKEKTLNEKRIDSINLATQKFIDSLKAIRYKNYYPEITIETRKFEGFDNKGFKAEYIIYLIRGFNWRLGEIAVGEEDGFEFEICDYLGSSGLNSRINNENLKAIICLGNTSFEEDLSVPENLRLKKEEDRSEKRANKLANCVNGYVEKLTPIFTLNLGKHLIETDFSEWQRQILIIGLIKGDSGVIEEEALYNGLVKEFIEENIEFNIMDYSKVDNITKRLIMKKVYN